MPYSKAWRSSMYPDFKEDGAYVDYKGTKDILRRMKYDDMGNPSTPNELYESLLRQKEVVYKWCERKRDELVRVAKALYEGSEQLSEEGFPIGGGGSVNLGGSTDMGNNTNNSFAPGSNLDRGQFTNLKPREARLAAEAILFELLRFVECRNLNTDTIEHIILRVYRYAVLGPTGDRWKHMSEQWDYYQLSLDLVFFYLSTVFDRITQLEERLSPNAKAKMSTGAVGSQVFDRRSVKYWVHMQDLPFVIARIIPHLPLSTFKDTYKDSITKKLPFTLYSPVSSIYYDNNKFLFYHRRLERVEESTIIRMRWYSDTYAEDWDRLEPTDNVFMEIKVHHEAWSGERSNKRRFALKEKEVDAFVAGQLSLQPALEKLQRKNASEAEQEKFKSLATEILTKIHAYNLKPVLKTQCGRAAFQRGADQTVRVSIDTNLHMSAEDFGLDHHWRYAGSDAPLHDFPYAVVEVKLQCAENERIPAWIEELMGCRYMESIPKYSKYGHGIASLYGHTAHIKMVPYWVHQMDIDIRASTKAEPNHWDPTVGLASGCFERTADRIVFGSGFAAQTQKIGASQARFLVRSDYAKVYQRMVAAATPAAGKKLAGSQQQGVSATTAVVPVAQYNLDRRHSAYTAFHLYPYTENGVEALCYDPRGSRNGAAHVFYGSIPWQTGKRIKVPQKYDPKTLLTSERYMVKWMEFAVQFGLLGIASIRFGRGLFLPNDIAHLSPFWQSNFHVMVGVIMNIIALLTLVYAYIGFKARARRVYGRRKIRYDDVVAPTWLTFILAFGFAMLASVHIAKRYGPMLTDSNSF